MEKVKKKQLQNLLEELMGISKKRTDKQGLVVFEKILLELENCKSNEELKESIEKLNKTLNGIEAHGYFSEKEYLILKEIRKI